MPYWDHKRRRRKNCVSFFSDPYSHPQTVWKVSARAEKSVHHYRGDYEFSILGGGNYTFKTVSPVTAWQPRWGTGERIPRTPFGRFAPSLVAFSASFWGSVISMILTVWRLKISFRANELKTKPYLTNYQSIISHSFRINEWLITNL